MVACLFGTSSLPVLNFLSPPSSTFNFQSPITFTISLSITQPTFLSVHLLTADFLPHILTIRPLQENILFAESKTYKFENFYVTKKEVSECNDSEELLKSSRKESIRIMVEAATSSTATILVSDVIHQQNETSIEVVDVSQTTIRDADEKLWILLNTEPKNSLIHIQFENDIIPIEKMEIDGKLIIISIPKTLREKENIECFKVVLRNGNQQIEIPFSFETIDTKCDPQINSLFEFASGGDPIALLKPKLHLLINHKDDELCNVLHIAARNRQNFALKILLTALLDFGSATDLDACINAVNRRGMTPLHCAVHAGDADCVHYLISAGAKKGIADNDSNTVAHYLGEVYNDDIYKEILESSQKEGHEMDGLSDNPLFQKNHDGETPMHIAVRKMKLGLLEALIEAGAPLDVPNADEETALIIALKMNDTESANLLIQNKCDVNVTSSSGDTTLMLACHMKNLVLIGRLIDAGADISQCSHDGRKPMDIDDDDIRRILNGERIPTEELENDSRKNLTRLNQAEILEQSTSVYSSHLDKDISELDFLTRLRLSKILDKDEKWTIFAEHLGCAHMVQFIRVCIDESSSPTMMLLDQYEQIANANLAAVKQALSEMGEVIGVRLITTGNAD